MAVVYVTEYARQVRDMGGYLVPTPEEPALAEQQVAIGGSSDQSSAFNDSAKLIMVHTDAICHIAIGSDPTASTSTKRMPADQTLFFGVQPGHKIAVITGS